MDDLNLAEASLISALTRLKNGETTWEHSFVIAGREMHVECLGTRYGFPHGPDNDTMLLITNLFLEYGQPSDRAIECSAYVLLRMLGRTDSSQNYRILHDSLTRLAGTLYKISGWLDHPGGTARRVTFRFLERIEEVAAEPTKLNLRSFGNGTKLRITLDSEVAASLASPRVRLFDLNFMLKLPSSQSRTLFRLLDTFWYSNPQAAKNGYLEFELVELGRLLRLTNLRPDSIRRLLLNIHDELIASEFLKGAELIGRGAGQTVRYVLNSQRPDYPLGPEQLELVGKIKALGIPDVQAREYIRRKTPQIARDRVALAQEIVGRTVKFRKGPGAYAWDILNDETGKYTHSAPTGPGQKDVTLVPRRPDIGLAFQQSEEAVDLEFQAMLKAEEELTPEMQWTKRQPVLRLMLYRLMGANDWNLFEARCRAGEFSALEEAGRVTSATANQSMQEYVENLRERLREI